MDATAWGGADSPGVTSPSPGASPTNRPGHYNQAPAPDESVPGAATPAEREATSGVTGVTAVAAAAVMADAAAETGSAAASRDDTPSPPPRLSFAKPISVAAVAPVAVTAVAAEVITPVESHQPPAEAAEGGEAASRSTWGAKKNAGSMEDEALAAESAVTRNRTNGVTGVTVDDVAVDEEALAQPSQSLDIWIAGCVCMSCHIGC